MARPTEQGCDAFVPLHYRQQRLPRAMTSLYPLAYDEGVTTPLPGVFFDYWRAQYETFSFTDHQRIYSVIERVYPEQVYYDRQAVATLLQKLLAHDIRPCVLELGGWKGELARDMLAQFPQVALWANVEICREAVTKRVCQDPRYTATTLGDFFWRAQPAWAEGYNTIVLSHVVEHMRLQDFAGTIAHCAAKAIAYLYIDIPDLGGGEPQGWQGLTATHILEGGWNDLEAILAQHGYLKFSGESTPRWYASQRGMQALRKEQSAYASA